jgi:hypothetical protein
MTTPFARHVVSEPLQRDPQAGLGEIDGLVHRGRVGLRAHDATVDVELSRDDGGPYTCWIWLDVQTDLRVPHGSGGDPRDVCDLLLRVDAINRGNVTREPHDHVVRSERLSRARARHW